MVKRRNYALKDKNLTPEERENLKKQYDAQLKSRKKQLDEFKKESKLSENIKK
jgi:F0F1-type ATP synthase epsilon subunit